MNKRTEKYVNVWENLVKSHELSAIPFYEQLIEVRRLLEEGALTADEMSALTHYVVHCEVECKLVKRAFDNYRSA